MPLKERKKKRHLQEKNDKALISLLFTNVEPPLTGIITYFLQKSIVIYLQGCLFDLLKLFAGDRY